MDRSDPSRLKLRRALARWGRGLLILIPFSAHAEPACQPPAKPMARLELIFGAEEKVSERRFMAFLGKEVTPRFPDGLSLFSGYGQWRNGERKIQYEVSRMLLIWYVQDAQSNAKIEAIRQAYKKRFHQQSVLRADGISCVSF